MIMLEGKTPEAPTLADVLLDTHDAVDAIRGTRVDRLDILPADGRLADLTALLAEVELGRERRLSVASHPSRAPTASAWSTRRRNSRS